MSWCRLLQVQAVQHRHPAGPGPGGAGGLAEADVQFPERAPAEMDVGNVEKHSLLAADPGVIQGAEQGIVAGRGGVLAGGGDPGLEEAEELRHPFRGRRRFLRRGVVADMAGGIVLIHRADQPDPERRLDLDGLADLQEPVEALEYLQVIAAGRRRPARCRQVTHDPVDVPGGDLPRRAAERLQHPLQHADVVIDRAGREPPRGPRGNERLHAVRLEDHRVDRNISRGEPALDETKPGLDHAHTFFAPANSRRHLEDQCLTMNTTSHTRRA